MNDRAQTEFDTRPGLLVGKALVLVTEDWFALSHFRPLIRTLAELAGEVVVATRFSGREGEIRALGARVVDFEYHRSSINPAREAATAWRLGRVIAAERPDVVHLIALKPIVLAALALRRTVSPRPVVHMTGLGLLAVVRSPKGRLLRAGALRLVGSLIRRPASWLLLENTDDLELLRRSAADPGHRVTILGGAGVDPDHFAALPPPDNSVPVAAYVGRMIMSKGVDVLLEAHRRLAARGVALRLALYGKIDRDNPDAIQPEALTASGDDAAAPWHGHVEDVRGVWRDADIFVMAPRGGEGLPRALLEAAACARPLVVTDVSGCRHFVRDGVEGLIVPPGDAEALAAALERLARDGELRRRLGAAARARVLAGFREADVQAAVRAAYRQLMRDSG